METVLLTTSDDVANSADAIRWTHVAIKFGEFYLAYGSGFADLLYPPGTIRTTASTAFISQELKKYTFCSLIPTSKGLSRDFTLRRVYVSDVYVCPAITHTIRGELQDVTFGNTQQTYFTTQTPELFHAFILFGESESSDGRKEEALRKLYSLTIPMNRSRIWNSVAVISTPFKNLTMFNSYSQGVISNVFGYENSVFLIDVKLSQGSEGSPVFSLDNRLFGVVMNVFTWAKGEWMGFSLAVNLNAALQSWINSLHPEQNVSLEQKPCCGDNHKLDSFGVVLVSSSNRWASGVILNKDEGIVITCSHAVDFTIETIVSITFKGKDWVGKVLYATPRDTPYDLAVIKLFSTEGLEEVVEFKKPTRMIQKGEVVYVIGFPLFSSRTCGVKGPSLSRGYVANVHAASMVFTTCVTNSGSSGGALIRSNGELLGIVTNNLIRKDEELLIPHITIVVPFDVFWTPMERFYSSQQVDDLKVLTTFDESVRKDWQLVFAGRFLKSKL